RRLIGQRLLMRVQTEVDDMADAECLYLGQLRLSWLPRCRYTIINSPPVVDALRVGHCRSPFRWRGYQTTRGPISRSGLKDTPLSDAMLQPPAARDGGHECEGVALAPKPTRTRSGRGNWSVRIPHGIIVSGERDGS